MMTDTRSDVSQVIVTLRSSLIDILRDAADAVERGESVLTRIGQAEGLSKVIDSLTATYTPPVPPLTILPPPRELTMPEFASPRRESTINQDGAFPVHLHDDEVVDAVVVGDEHPASGAFPIPALDDEIVDAVIVGDTPRESNAFPVHDHTPLYDEIFGTDSSKGLLW